MAIIQVNTDPSRKQLNQFGFIWLGFLIFFASVAWFKFESQRAAGTLLVLSILVPAIGWIVPAFMRLVFVGLSYVAFPVGFVVSHVLLALVYYCVVTPIGLLVRMLGHDPMQKRLEPEADSYWMARDPHPDAKQYFRQY